MAVNKRKSLSEKEHCVYRYVENGSGKILYVGKTNSSLRARVCAHRYEEQFQIQKPFHVEYIVLENEVETDSVEKFFINKWKPPLNVKDKVFGLSEVIATEMERIKWRSYSDYENERQSSPVIKKLSAQANINSQFLYSLLMADSSNKFAFPYLVTDVSFLYVDDRECSIISKEVIPGSGGYTYTLLDGARDYIQKHHCEIEASIWMPVLLVCKMTDDEELKYSVYMQQLEFCNEIDAFADNGYEDSNSAYRYNFRTEYPGADVYFPFSTLFDGAPYTNLKNRVLNGEISSFSYETEMPRIKDKISECLLEFVYNLKTPVVTNELITTKNLLRESLEFCGEYL